MLEEMLSWFDVHIQYSECMLQEASQATWFFSNFKAS